MNVICPYCQRDAELVTGDDVYPGRPDLHDRRFWVCTPCDARVGCHRTGDGTVPMGRLADDELRRARVAAHLAFDSMWRSERFGRDQGYRWLAGQLGIDTKACHIAMMDVETCRRVVEVCA